MPYQVQRGGTIAKVTRLLGIEWKTLRRANPHAVGQSSRTGRWFLKEGATLRDIGHFALMAYNKKPEYGPASLSAVALDYDGSGTLQACQRRQMLMIDGKRMHTQRIDVEALYEEGFMRK